MAEKRVAGPMQRLKRVESKIDRLETRFDHLETRFDGLEVKVDDLAMYVVATETRLGEKIDSHARRYDVQIEHVRDDIRRLAESVGSVIERLDRQHAAAQALTTARLAGHDLILREYGRRITALESPPS